MIAKNIRRIRASAGLSEADCSAKLRVSLQQIERYERGTERVPASRLILLANLLRVPIGAFFEMPKASASDVDDGKILSLVPALRRQASHSSAEAELLRSFRAIQDSHDKQLVVDLAARLADEGDDLVPHG